MKNMIRVVRVRVGGVKFGIGVVLAIMVGAVLIGGIRRIGDLTTAYSDAAAVLTGAVFSTISS